MGWQDDPVVSQIPGASPDLAAKMIADDKAGKIVDVKVGADGNQVPFWAKDAVVSTPKPVAGNKMSEGMQQLEAIQPSVKPTATPEPTFADKWKGTNEAISSLLTALPAQAAGAIAGILKGVTGGEYGTAAGVENAAKTASDVSKSLTYQPRTETGKAALEAVGSAMDASKLAGINPATVLPSVVPGAGKALIKGAKDEASLAGGAVKSAVGAIENTAPLSQAEQAAASSIAKGYVLPPTQVNPSAMNRLVEGWAGKWNMSQEASIKNQPVTNNLAKSAIGLRRDAPLDVAALDSVRAEAGAPYGAIKSLEMPITLDEKFAKSIDNLMGDYSAAAKRFPGQFKDDKIYQLRNDLLTDPAMMLKEPLPGTNVPSIFKTLDKAAIEQPGPPILNTLEQAASELHPHGYGQELSAADRAAALPINELKMTSMTPSEAIELVKTLRFRASNRLAGAAFENPENRALGLAERSAANEIDSLIERRLTEAGQGKLANQYREGRTRIAQTYDIQAALNDVTGNVDARKIAFLGKKRPFSGALADIAEFGNIGREVAAPPETFGGHPGINPLDIGLAGVQAASGKPGAAMRGLGIAAGRPVMAKLGTSDWYQNAMVSPRRNLSNISTAPSLAELSAEQRK